MTFKNRTVATDLMKAIDQSIASDNGNAYRAALKILLPKMEDAYRQDEGGFRSHLGASLIGKECQRELWYGFRWAVKKNISPRIYRLFNRGHLEEARFLAALISAGVQVHYETEDGGQFKFSTIGGHFGSALDAVLVNVPGLPPGAPAYGEFKTHSEKSFNKVVKEGVNAAKPEHYTQMQVCMDAYDIPYGVYLAVNKNNDEFYAEIIEQDRPHADRTMQAASNIIFSADPPPKINTNPSFFVCKFCDARDVCQLGRYPEKNCRTCYHSRPNKEGGWTCAASKPHIETDPQFKKSSCESYTMNPSLENKE